jgi:hypothetical protein
MGGACLTEAGRLRVQGQPGLHSEILNEKKEEKRRVNESHRGQAWKKLISCFVF